MKLSTTPPPSMWSTGLATTVGRVVDGVHRCCRGVRTRASGSAARAAVHHRRAGGGRLERGCDPSYWHLDGDPRSARRRRGRRHHQTAGARAGTAHGFCVRLSHRCAALVAPAPERRDEGAGACARPRDQAGPSRRRGHALRARRRDRRPSRGPGDDACRDVPGSGRASRRSVVTGLRRRHRATGARRLGRACRCRDDVHAAPRNHPGATGRRACASRRRLADGVRCCGIWC